MKFKNLYLQNISNYIDKLVPDDLQSKEEACKWIAAKTNLELADDELEDLKQKYSKYREIESKLGFKLTELEEVDENSIYVTSSKEIHFNGDDFYGDYTPEELKQLIKNILGEYLRCMREAKRIWEK